MKPTKEQIEIVVAHLVAVEKNLNESRTNKSYSAETRLLATGEAAAVKAVIAFLNESKEN
jgi:hypothetical protein